MCIRDRVVSSSGQPGKDANIVLRGIGSISASNNALIVVDGVPVSYTHLCSGFSYTVTKIFSGYISIGYERVFFSIK